ncbi:ring-opening amidohydrolase [Roseibium aggregatum]|uniref:Cyanuric acid amidohydrolase n=1 Tax=Roseibium aggregatum TaxID=187304 RepID=A0A926P6B4_9HYPH|nr:ring-opening amidohydrolase [Roseibium aggregatum]MBD1548627.1 ring-opening amidohydrolase [Roseibium aggregatum]
MDPLLREARVHRLPMSSPDDTSAIETLVEQGKIDPKAVVAVLGKTEGNGCVNDFTRGYAVQSLRFLFGRYMEPADLDRICMVMSGGTEGALSPHWIVLEALPATGVTQTPALALGVHVTEDFAPVEIGRMAQVTKVADGVRKAMVQAGISDPKDVHFVQIKCPLLTAERVRAAGGAHAVATADTLRSMGLSRGASALGVAVALGEIDETALSDTAIGDDLSLYSTRASCSAGVELMGCEILVMGMSDMWSGPLTIGHALMRDALDIDPIRETLSNLGISAPGQFPEETRERVTAVLVKAEASKSGHARGFRHTMLDDSDISSTRHARGFVAGVLAGLIGQTELFVSGGAEHQGPDGGGPCAVIGRRSDP